MATPEWFEKAIEQVSETTTEAEKLALQKAAAERLKMERRATQKAPHRVAEVRREFQQVADGTRPMRESSPSLASGGYVGPYLTPSLGPVTPKGFASGGFVPPTPNGAKPAQSKNDQVADALRFILDAIEDAKRPDEAARQFLTLVTEEVAAIIRKHQQED